MNHPITETEKLLAWREHRQRVRATYRRFWVSYFVVMILAIIDAVLIYLSYLSWFAE